MGHLGIRKRKHFQKEVLNSYKYQLRKKKVPISKALQKMVPYTFLLRHFSCVRLCATP